MPRHSLMRMDKDTAKKLDDFRAAAAVTAEEIIFKTFPNKVFELQARIDASTDPSSIFHISHASESCDLTIYPPPESPEEPDAKKRKRADGAANGVATDLTIANNVHHARYTNLVHSNKHMDLVYAELKNECEQLASSCDKVKLWVNLSMPQIEDGDNFGVQIQEEVLSEIHRSQDSAYTLRDAARQDHLNRAKMCSKLVKYPHVEDYTLALKEHDEKQLFVARQTLFDLRNVYAVLTDILHKNINKIRTPKGNNSSGLY